MTPPGIEPVTFRFVAQHLNHCATAVPHDTNIPENNVGDVSETTSSNYSRKRMLQSSGHAHPKLLSRTKISKLLCILSTYGQVLSFRCGSSAFKVYIYIYIYTHTYVCVCVCVCVPGNSVGIATELGAGRFGIESQCGRDIPPVQTGPGARPASCKMGTGSFLGVKWGRGVLMTTHPLLVPRSWKSRAIPLPTLWATPGP